MSAKCKRGKLVSTPGPSTQATLYAVWKKGGQDKKEDKDVDSDVDADDDLPVE